MSLGFGHSSASESRLAGPRSVFVKEGREILYSGCGKARFPAACTLKYSRH